MNLGNAFQSRTYVSGEIAARRVYEIMESTRLLRNRDYRPSSGCRWGAFTLAVKFDHEGQWTAIDVSWPVVAKTQPVEQAA